MTNMTEAEVPGLPQYLRTFYEKVLKEEPTRLDKLVGYTFLRPVTLEELASLLLPADIEQAQQNLEQFWLQAVRRYGKTAAHHFPPTVFVRPGFYKTMMLVELRQEFWHEHVSGMLGAFRPTQ